MTEIQYNEIFRYIGERVLISDGEKPVDAYIQTILIENNPKCLVQINQVGKNVLTERQTVLKIGTNVYLDVNSLKATPHYKYFLKNK